MMLFFIGKTGSGKTYEMVRTFVKLKNTRENKVSNIHLKVPHKYYPMGDVSILKERCAVMLLDEAGLFINARDFKNMTDEARDFAILNRKWDVLCLASVQSLRYIDSMYREQDCEVRIPRILKFPFLGWIVPDSVVKTKKCAMCHNIPFDVFPDDRGISKFFGVGSFLIVDRYRLSELSEQGAVASAQAARGSETAGPIRAPRPFGFKVHLYSQKIADMYDTHETPEKRTKQDS